MRTLVNSESIILVTGADGFIGSHLVEELVKRGHKVRAFVMYNSFNSWGWLDNCDPKIKGNFEVFSGDIRDPNCVREAINGCEVVFHLAALIAIPFSYRSPDSYVDTNIKGTLNVLQACKEFNVNRLIHTSTSEVYGTAQFVPINENHPLVGQSPYSATKIAADQLAYSFYSSFGLPVITIRPFNTYGPRQSARAVIPTIITQLLNNAPEVQLGATTPTRDFNFIEDTVSGFIAAMESKNSFGETINIGSGYEISIQDTFDLIASITGASAKSVLAIERTRPVNSEVERLWADNTKAKRLLDWSPKYSGVEGLRRGLIKTIEWFSTPENLRGYKSQNYNI